MPFDPNTFKSPDSLPHNATKFDPATFKSPEQAQAEQQQAKVKELASISPTKAALQGMISAVADQAAGIAQVALPGLPQTKDLASNVKQDSDARYAQAKEAHPNYAMGGYAVGAIAPALAIPGGEATSAMGKIGEAAAMGAGIGNAQYVEGNDPAQRLGNTAVGGAVGGAVAAIPAAFQAGREWIGGSANLAKQEIGAHVAQSDPIATMNAVGASERTGIHLTPGEATGNKVLLAEEGRIPMEGAVQYKVAQTVANRNAAATKEAKSLTGSLIPEGTDKLSKAVNAAYKKSEPAIVPIDSMRELSQYPAFKKAETTVLKKLGPDAPKPGTVGYLDTIKRYLDDEISTGLASGKSSKGVEVSALQNLKKKIVDAATSASPDYATARQGAQKLIVKQHLEDQLSKVSDEYGTITPATIRKAWFKTSDNSKEFYNNLQQVTDDPKVIQRAKDLELVLNRLGNSTYDKLLGANTAELSRFEAAKGPTAFAKLQIYRKIFGRRDKAVVDLISNPHWHDELSKLAKSKASDTQLGKKFTDLLSRASAKTATNPSTTDQ